VVRGSGPSFSTNHPKYKSVLEIILFKPRDLGCIGSSLFVCIQKKNPSILGGKTDFGEGKYNWQNWTHGHSLSHRSVHGGKITPLD